MKIKIGQIYSSENWRRWRYFMFLDKDKVINWTEDFAEKEIVSGSEVSTSNLIDVVGEYFPQQSEYRTILMDVLQG